MSPTEIVNSGLWYSGDYEPSHECNCSELFHTCSYSPTQDFHSILENIEMDFDIPSYVNLFQQIKTRGFIYSLGALMKKDYSGIGLIDGHHRLFIALSLKIAKIPVNISSPNTDIVNITRWDSNMWSGV